MPKKAHLENHLSADELKRGYLHASEPVESRRWHLLWMVCSGWTIKKAAQAIAINYDYAKEIVHKYNSQGVLAIQNQKKMVRRQRENALLNAEVLEKLGQALKNRPTDGGIWTGPKVARWIEQETGREKVWPQRGWDYLKRLRYSPQRPRPKHYKGDKNEQEAFKKNSVLE
ncbi:helix-turn-helix domain-containing protein [Brasilonema octagenarum]|uniref:Winged helix-turn helix domain-containing protein n=1 Tax=Brasilonema octagenarum UFV-OR1 TaxID=417115 RepID=A0ABX1M177_9CYAN|nr:winged helix-turn-helix domain-containing protein [Brasilonema octagenarum]NMF62239.1 hypothetical protein [Brasilonema octagenarum UFV-OR1]